MKLKKLKIGVIFTLIFLSTFSIILAQSYKELDQLKTKALTAPIIADHTVANYVRLDLIPDENITEAKNTLHIAYGHTSHGSQITTGMTGLPAFKESKNGTEGLYDWNEGGTDGALDIDDYFMSGDLGNPDRTTWADRTRSYLDLPENADVNVVMWSWCGQVSSASEADIITYLTLMNDLEFDYPNVSFIYMTGHVDGTGLDGNLHIRNEQIREYCRDNNKILFDFADIESYDPDGNYYGDKLVNDNCDYDSNNDTIRDANWAIEWQNNNPGEWYSCSSAHSQPLNANMKAYAAWWLWATLSGWNTTETPTFSPNPSTYSSSPTFPLNVTVFMIVGITFPILVLITRVLVKRRIN